MWGKRYDKAWSGSTLLAAILLLRHAEYADAFESLDRKQSWPAGVETPLLDPAQLQLPRSEAGKSKVAALKDKYARSLDASSGNWIVITSVNPPTRQVQRICGVKGWNKVIVGDKKTPKWELQGCLFLSVEDQAELEYKSHSHIPYNRYERKMLGYLFAIEMGAHVILDTDDDNIPAAITPYVLEPNIEGSVCADVVNRSKIAWNAYRHFGVPHLHNRGLPFRHVRPGQALEYEEIQRVKPLIQQGVVHCDPDLDAIQRLTMSPAQTSDVKFSHNSFLAFPPTSFHPINSQNTVFRKEAFWALLLPVTTLWREDDIFRGYWSQRLLWEIGGSLVITGPTAYQLRNPHDFFLDYKMEVNMYNKAEDMLLELNAWSCAAENTLDVCITSLISHLHAKGFISKVDVDLATLWVADLKSLGYSFPARVEGVSTNSKEPCATAEGLPESFTTAIQEFSKEELQITFDSVEDYEKVNGVSANE
jgi:hypothetical protein